MQMAGGRLGGEARLAPRRRLQHVRLLVFPPFKSSMFEVGWKSGGFVCFLSLYIYIYSQFDVQINVAHTVSCIFSFDDTFFFDVTFLKLKYNPMKYS